MEETGGRSPMPLAALLLEVRDFGHKSLRNQQ
jgi:hypothetical protein